MRKLYKDMSSAERKNLYLKSNYVRAKLGFQITGYAMYLRDYDRYVKMYEETYIDKHGVLRWKTSNNVPPEELLLLWKYERKRFDLDITLNGSNNDLKRVINESRKYEANMSDEARRERELEMRAAFGPGVDVVNVLTGKKYRT